jgi:hypothetical protein
MLAQAFLAVQRARAAAGTGAAERAEPAEPLVALSVPEVRRLLCAGVAAAGRAGAGAWLVVVRRRHQARARRSHWQRRQRRKVRL